MVAIYAFEGPDGCGKTTAVDETERKLKERGYEVIRYRQPGGTKTGEVIRGLLLNPEYKMDGISQAYLFAACRQEVINDINCKIKNHDGKKELVVLIDRWNVSTMVYQKTELLFGDTPATEVESALELLEIICKSSSTIGDIKPVIITINAPFEETVKRRPLDIADNRFESGGRTKREYQYNLYTHYFQRPFQTNTSIMIDGGGTVDETVKQILDVIDFVE